MSDNLAHKLQNEEIYNNIPEAEPAGEIIDFQTQARTLRERKNQDRSRLEKLESTGRRAEIAGKVGEKTGQALQAGGKVTKNVGGAVGSGVGQASGATVGAGVGAVGGAISGGIAGLAAGGVGAIPGAMAGLRAGASAGAKTGQNIGKQAGKTAGQAPGQVMEKSGSGLRIGGKSVNKAGKNLKQSSQALQSAPMSIGQQIQGMKNLAQKAASGDVVGTGVEAAQLGGREGSKVLLTTLWGSVWLDWTLLSLLGLNVFLVMSLVLPKFICQFGEDYLIGKWLPSPELAKYLEIILLMIINIIVASIIALIIYIIYSIYNCGLTGQISIFIADILPGGDTGVTQALECIQ